MTTQQIQRLSGRRLNEAVARECFGWEIVRGVWQDPLGYRHSSPFPWHTETYCHSVLEWLNRRESFAIYNEPDFHFWRIVIFKRGESIEVTGRTFAIAVCRAAVWAACNKQEQKP